MRTLLGVTAGAPVLPSAMPTPHASTIRHRGQKRRPARRAPHEEACPRGGFTDEAVAEIVQCGEQSFAGPFRTHGDSSFRRRR
jgi:hypothetical protein